MFVLLKKQTTTTTKQNKKGAFLFHLTFKQTV